MNVIFVESCPPFFGEEQDCEEGPRPSGPAPSTSVQDSNCNPADFDTEDWDAGLARETFVFEDISAGIRWWASHGNKPKNLSFIFRNQGRRFTWCEPIERPSTDEGLWIADIVKTLPGGLGATPQNYHFRTRDYVYETITAENTDFGFVIFVVDSFRTNRDAFTDGKIAYGYLDGPFMVLTYDVGFYTRENLDVAARHETGHIFGAFDEYMASGCQVHYRYGYLNEQNLSCDNGGVTGDISIMGDTDAITNRSHTISQGTQNQIGWRNPQPLAGISGRYMDDVVDNATVSLEPFLPDPTSDTTPKFRASGSNEPYPPGGCVTDPRYTVCYEPYTIARVAKAHWKLDGAFQTMGTTPVDGVWDERTEAYTFRTLDPVPVGPHTFVRDRQMTSVTSRRS